MQNICLAHAEDSGIGPIPVSVSDEAGNNPALHLSTVGRKNANSEQRDRWCAGSCASSTVPGVRIAPSASAMNRMVGIGGVVDGVSWTNSEGNRREYDITKGSCTQVNAYTAALAAKLAQLSPGRDQKSAK